MPYMSCGIVADAACCACLLDIPEIIGLGWKRNRRHMDILFEMESARKLCALLHDKSEIRISTAPREI